MASAREQRGLSTVVRVMTVVLAASCPLPGAAVPQVEAWRRTRQTQETNAHHPIYLL